MIKECPDMLPMSTVTRPFLAKLALLTLTTPCLAFVGPQYTFGRYDFQTGTFPSGVVVADVNGDGKEDVIVANQLDNTVSVFLGQPNGIFGAPQNFPTAAGPVALVVADFNHDGKLDLAVVASSANVVSVLLGNGNGTFRPAVNYPTGQGPYALAAGDFNHDGNVDLAVVDSCGPNSCSNTVSILLAKADGTFQSKKDYPVGATPIAIAAHDLNGDGNLDLAVANSGGNSISILLGNANGTFKPSLEAATEAAPCGITIGDFDGDKIPDLAVTHQNAPWALTVLKGNGNGTFQAEQQVAQLVDTNEVVAVDVNRDGKTDLVLTVVSQVMADSTGDGILDVAVAAEGSGAMGNLEIMLGTGGGKFAAPVEVASPEADFFPLTAGDLNQDGTSDLVTAGAGGGSLFLSGPVATVSPTILDFGAIKVGNTSTPRTITLVNTGNASLKVNTVAATSGYKVIADTCGSPVKQRSFCSFKIEFIPVVSGAYIGILSIGDNAPRGKQTVTLLGKGTP